MKKLSEIVIFPVLAILLLTFVLSATRNTGQETSTGAIVTYDPLAEVSGGFGTDASLFGTGFMARTAPANYAQRSLIAGAGISITNNAGLLGNPTISALSFPVASTTATTSGISRTTASFAVMPEMTLTLANIGGTTICIFSGGFNLQDGDIWDMAIFADAVEVPFTRRRERFTATAGILGLTPGSMDIEQGMSAAIPSAAGNHTYDVRWQEVGAGSSAARGNGTSRRLDCFER